MSRLNPFIIPPVIEDDAPRCKLCYSEVQSRDDLFAGICYECCDALEERYKAMLREAFEADEIEWLNESNEITGDVSIWLEEVAEK